jgi:[glutamine synthetase] adenylyltransferase / [glutamine synthetase]-adenylyl-L-tyrosine phosphorylase
LKQKKSSELPGKKFEFSQSFVKKLVEHTDGTVEADVFEAVLAILEKESAKFYFTQSSESNLLRIFTAIYDRAFFFQDIEKYPHHGEILIAISASSNYLTDITVRNPELLYQMFDQEYLTQKLELSFLQNEIDTGISKFKTFNAKLNFILKLKRRFILKIGLTDILGMAELVSITGQLSFLARIINAKLFELCYKETLLKYNLPDTSHNFCLCSLGKLGGNELNYSSDIDLILFYDSNEFYKEIKKEYHEILSEAVKFFIKCSSEISDKGFIYRVDFRLRPDGRTSELCKTLNDYIKYYETRGEDWERQMLIKLDYVCGDKKLFDQFRNFTLPYIYQTTFSSSIKDKVRMMKTNIEIHNKGKGNVKTFSGGIRDIEFSVQALQMLNGGRIKQLRTGNTLTALEELRKNNLLAEEEKNIFNEAYIFYRRIEHFLQLMNDSQTHIIPEDIEFRHRLANFLKIKSVKNLNDKINDYRIKVRSIYDNILKNEGDEVHTTDFSKISFKDSSKAEKNIKFLRSGEGIFERKEFDSRTIELFSQIEPALTGFLQDCTDPDKTLENFAKIIRFTKFPSIWYNAFGRNKLFEGFLKVCLYSQRAVDLISASRMLEENFISGKAFINDPEEETQTYRTEEIIFFAAIQFALGLADSQKISSIFSRFIERELIKICGAMNIPYKYCLCGLGSFGAQSMNFASDVDLVIIVEDVAKSNDVQKDFQKMLAKAKELLKPFDVDFRLRPEGKSSPLVWDIKNYSEYINKRARVWEFQTLLKLKFVYGDKDLFEDFTNRVFDKVKSLDPDFVKQEMLKMYAVFNKEIIKPDDKTFHIKKERGGGLTVDFILQWICLKDILLYKKMMGKSVREIITLLKDKFEPGDVEILAGNFSFLKDLELAIQNIFNTNQGIVYSNKDKKAILVSFYGMKSIDELDKKLNNVIKTNNQFFEKYVTNN